MYDIIFIKRIFIVLFLKNLKRCLSTYFLVVAALLLVLGFYFSFRASRDGEACETGSSKISRASRPTLFVASLATAGFSFFPSLVGFASGGGDTLAPQVESNVIVLRVEGMTCESCASDVRAHLLDVPGVIDAAVSYERKVAEMRVREERAPEVGVLIEAVEKAGFTASLETR